GHVELLTSSTYPGLVYKPVTAGELYFYQCLPEALAPYTSVCYGTCQIPALQVDADLGPGGAMPPAFLIMEDITAGMKEPAVLDLKLGFRQRAAHHGPSKRSSMKAKCARSTSRVMGFRLCGLRYFDPATRKMRKSSKKEGQQECQDSVLEKLLDYLRPLRGQSQEADEADVRSIHEITELLGDLSDVIRQLPGFRFWGCSLLLARDVSYCFGQGGPKKTVCKLIDFSNFHMTYGDTVDLEFLTVLENVQRCLAHCAAGTDMGELLHAPDLRFQDLEQVGVKEKRVGAAGRLLLNAALGEADGHVASGKVHEGQGLREGNGNASPWAPLRTIALPCASVLNSGGQPVPPARKVVQSPSLYAPPRRV
ncbi:unnamed protein product, partial [Symbiodinium natans]